MEPQAGTHFRSKNLPSIIFTRKYHETVVNNYSKGTIMAEGNETHLDPENTDDTPPAPQAKQETTPHSIDNETDQQNAAADIFETTISCSNQDSLVDQKIEQTETAPRAGENLEKAENIPISHKEVSDSISPQDQSLKTQADETGHSVEIEKGWPDRLYLSEKRAVQQGEG